MSYVDPEILYGKLAAGDAGRINAAADPITAAMSALERAKGSITQGGSTSASAWQGQAASAFATRAEQSGTATENARGRLEGAVKVVQAAATAYGRMRTPADSAIQAWRNRPQNLDEAATRKLAEQVNTALDRLRESYEGALRAYARSLGTIKPAFAETAGDTPAWQQTTPQAGLTVPPPGSDPRAVAQWWASLSETQRDQLLATQFDALGRLRGLPSDVLDSANRTRIAVDQQRFTGEYNALDARVRERANDPAVQARLDQLEAQYRELGIPFDRDSEESLRLTNDPQLADLLDQRADAKRGMDNAANAANSVQRAENLASERGITDGVRVLAWDPTGPRGDGGMAIAFGDPDRAANLTVSVPGTGSTLGSFSLEQAANLREQMDGVAGSGPNATIQWLGYDAPNWSPDQVASARQAQEGGDNLVADVDGYRAAAEAAGNRQHVTVIGHSYGSTTVGYAGMNGLAADDIAFVGSPGVGASDADQLSAGRGHVWAGATEHDPVVQGTSGDWFTADGSSTGPYDRSFGANVFGTPDGGNLSGAHSAYYEQGSESLANLGNIATGNYDDVTDQRWQDDPLPPELPGSDLPIIGPVIDQAANSFKETVDVVEDVGGGLWDTGGHVVRGEWGEAWDELADTGGELLNDAGDVIIGGIGDTVERGRDILETGADLAESAYDNTLGRIF